MLEPESKKELIWCKWVKQRMEETEQEKKTKPGCSVMPRDSPVRLRKQHGDMFIS